MSLSIAAHIPGQGSILLADSLTRKGDEIMRDARKNFFVPSIGAGVFVSGTFADLPAIIARRHERTFDDVASSLFVDLMTEDLTGVEYAPQLLMVTADRLLLRTPELEFSADSSAGIMAAGNWSQWYLGWHGIPVTSNFYRHPAKNVPDTLEECRAYIRSLAVRALTEIVQLKPMAAFPLYELTLTPDEIREDVIDDIRNTRTADAIRR